MPAIKIQGELDSFKKSPKGILTLVINEGLVGKVSYSVDVTDPKNSHSGQTLTDSLDNTDFILGYEDGPKNFSVLLLRRKKGWFNRLVRTIAWPDQDLNEGYSTHLGYEKIAQLSKSWNNNFELAYLSFR